VARLPGQHKGQGLTKAFTPFGLAYWFDPDNDGYGYLTNDLGATRYPISYIFGIAVPRSEPRGVDTQDQGRPPDVPTAALGSKIKAIYGIDRTPGDIFFGPRASASQNVLYVGRGFGEGPCDSLLQVQRGGDRADMLFFGFWTGYATWTFYPGVDSPPAADPSFVAVTGESAATFERYPGLCYVSETYTFQPDIMPGFPDVLFVIKGRKLYDPRKDSTNGGVGPHRFTDPTTWEWSDNAELVYADYRTNPYFGRGTPFAMIDWKAVRENANYCDEQMADGRKRFTINTTLGREADHDSNEDFLRSHFRASRWFMAGGKFTHYIDRPAYSVATFDESDQLRGRASRPTQDDGSAARRALRVDRSDARLSARHGGRAQRYLAQQQRPAHRRLQRRRMPQSRPGRLTGRLPVQEAPARRIRHRSDRAAMGRDGAPHRRRGDAQHSIARPDQLSGPHHPGDPHTDGQVFLRPRTL
jgi:hypothetical protein